MDCSAFGNALIRRAPDLNHYTTQEMGSLKRRSAWKLSELETIKKHTIAMRARARDAHAHAEIYIAKVINKKLLKYKAKVKKR